MGTKRLTPEHLEELKRMVTRLREIAGESGTEIIVQSRNPESTDSVSMHITVRETNNGNYDADNNFMDSIWKKDGTGFTGMTCVDELGTSEAAFGSDKDSDVCICDRFNDNRHPGWISEEVSA